MWSHKAMRSVFARGTSVLANLAQRFRSNVSGNVVVTFALVGLPVVLMMGAAVDFSQRSELDANIQDAADAAVLAAARSHDKTLAQKKDIADKWFNAATAEKSARLKNVSRQLVQLEDGLRYTVKAEVDTSFMGLAGVTKWEIGAVAEVVLGGKEVELSLVLDNTGSMSADMATLRSAATDLVNIVFSMDGGQGKVRVGLVPYVAAVNVGSSFPTSMVDVAGDNPSQATYLEWKWVARKKGCTPYWGGGGGGGGDPWNPGDPGNGAFIWDKTKTFAMNIWNETLGIRPAQAGNEDGAAHGLPPGYMYNNCYAVQPAKIKHLDLFNQIGINWKGCVEARPYPYDVNDAPPNPNNPKTMFVPYFWPDEADKFANWVSSYANNYMVDTPFLDPNVWEDQQNNEWHRTYNITKYTKTGKTITVDEVAPDTKGPNKACPDPIVPLTTDKTKLLNSIAGLKHWNNSGTISSEGVAWGWRVLSPGPPFTEGKPYDTPDLNKIMVIMSDGQNLIGSNNINGPTISNYSAYGYLRWGQWPEENFNKASKHIDDRMLEACQNAKAAGVTVYTILFRENDAKTVNLFTKCATKPPFFYKASTPGDLVKAFNDIGSQIAQLRLSK